MLCFGCFLEMNVTWMKVSHDELELCAFVVFNANGKGILFCSNPFFVLFAR